ncbi:unnamed protein product [Candidula unifasciata]|uniref:Glycosyltransferase family 92 protein n=1 Tax=Candidula unifasciata TaxID=100452 RepID=A0A8S3ZGI4_9EUPU|nr:unnamed protein product [Candidula unifasciata]
MNGWVRHKEPTSFKCCLLRSSSNGTLVDDVKTEVRSYTYNIYTQWIVERQNAEFSCSVSSTQITAIGKANFSYVTFAKDSCLKAPVVVLPILYPQPVPNSVCVCLKITYGNLKPEKVIEWFEYTRHMGTTKVFTYYAEVTTPVLKILQYYQSIGFLEMLPLEPVVSADGQKISIAKPTFPQQAWVDEVMAANDCKHRMAKYDFIIIMDMDEIIVPQGNMTSYFDILQAASLKMPDVCGFSFDAHVVALTWGATRSSPLLIFRYTNRTDFVNYDGADRNTRWAFRPKMTYWVQNNLIHCRDSLKISPIPNDTYTLLHYRSCKAQWTGCTEKTRVTDTSILKHELPLIDQILAMPLRDLVSDYDTYISALTDWKRNITHKR